MLPWSYMDAGSFVAVIVLANLGSIPSGKIGDALRAIVFGDY